MASSGMLHHVARVRTDVSEELSASFMRVTRIGELGTKLAVTSVVPSSPILVTLMKEALGSPKRLFLQESHGLTSQKTSFLISNSVAKMFLPTRCFKQLKLRTLLTSSDHSLSVNPFQKARRRNCLHANEAGLFHTLINLSDLALDWSQSKAAGILKYVYHRCFIGR
jgi:hypothetical protein